MSSRFAPLANGLATGLLVLTATTWSAGRDGVDPHTLWGLVEDGWKALVMLALVAGIALTTYWLFLAEPPTRAGHLVLVWLGLATAVWVIVLGALPDEDYDAAPGRWLTLVGALAVSAAHGFRAEELSKRGTG
jgi:hypothetical protein